MPWDAKDALRHTHHAKSKKAKHKWSVVANAVLRSTGDEGRAVRVANAAVHKHVFGSLAPKSGK